MRKKWGWFPYDADDYKAAQGWLDAQAAGGWALKRIYFGRFALLEEAETPRHMVDLCLGGELGEANDEAYLQLCDDAGWEPVQTLRGMLLFRAKPGADPAPIHTDEGIEWERFWKKYVLRNTLISTAVTAVALLMLWVIWMAADQVGARSSYAPLPASNGALMMGVGLALSLVYLLWSAGRTAVYWFRCKRAGAVVTLGRRSTMARIVLGRAYSILFVAGWLVLMLEGAGLFGNVVDLSMNILREEETATVEACRAYPVAMADDFGVEWTEAWSRYLDGRRSPLMDYLEYSEMVCGPGERATYQITCERYGCVSEPLARRILAQRKRETERGTGFLWGELPWAEAGLPEFDESYTCRGNAYLLLREGNVVALVGCSQGADLTSAAVRDMLWERLELE